MFVTILLCFAFVFFVLAALVVFGEPHRPRLVAAGLAAWVLSDLITRSGWLR